MSLTTSHLQYYVHLQETQHMHRVQLEVEE